MSAAIGAVLQEGLERLLEMRVERFEGQERWRREPGSLSLYIGIHDLPVDKLEAMIATGQVTDRQTILNRDDGGGPFIFGQIDLGSGVTAGLYSEHLTPEQVEHYRALEAQGPSGDLEAEREKARRRSSEHVERVSGGRDSQNGHEYPRAYPRWWLAPLWRSCRRLLRRRPIPTWILVAILGGHVRDGRWR